MFNFKKIATFAVLGASASLGACDNQQGDHHELRNGVVGLAAVDGGLAGSYSETEHQVWISSAVIDSALNTADDMNLDVAGAVIRVDDEAFDLDLATGLADLRALVDEGSLIRACLIDQSGQPYRISDLVIVDAQAAGELTPFVPSTLIEEYEL